MEPVVTVVITAAIAAVLTFVLIKGLDRLRLKDAESQARDIVEKADREIETRRKEAELEFKERAIAQKSETEKELSKVRHELHERERMLDKRQDSLEQQSDGLRKQEKMVETTQRKLAERIEETDRQNQELTKHIDMQRQTLHRLSGLNKEAATSQLLERIEADLSNEIGARIMQHEKRTAEICEEKSREILVTALQRYAAAHTAETTTSTVDIPSDDMKGRIIGREGRNIRTFEQLSGTDLIIDDTPEAVVISCFEPVRREIARVALLNLVNDGRIHPGRIEEMLDKAKAEVQQKMREAAEAATAEAHIRLPKGLLEVFGRLLYRTSYGQNILRHSVEVSTLASGIAAELGANVNVAKRAALLHDIGKALDHEHEGTHIDLGSELLRRHRETEQVIQAAEEHHLDPTSMSSLEAVIVQIADAISSARPGARRENVEIYIKRLENLEKIATSFDGVEKSFAIQAGRELRIVVKPEKVDDLAALKMSREVAQRIQDEMTYPGEIKVTVIRETRSVGFAK